MADDVETAPSAAARQRVERGLIPALELAGRPTPRCSLEERMTRYGVPGVAIAVIADDRIAWAAGYGTGRADGRRIEPTTQFQAASISKAVTAVGVLHLVEQGVLDLDEDVNTRLRRWRLPESSHTAGAPLTLRHLLSHTGATTVSGFGGYPQGAALPTLVDVLAGRPPANTPAVESFAAPGGATEYSGGGTTIVQLLVEDVTGRGFAALMDDLVLHPFGMRDSVFEQPLGAARAASAAVGHSLDGTPVPGGHRVHPELAAAGLWSTAVDLARWVLGVQRILRGEHGGPISPDTARRMVTPVGDGAFGLGPRLEGAGDRIRFGHMGANEGFRGEVDGLVHEPLGAAVLTNGDGGATLCLEVRKALADEYGWGPVGPPPVDVVDVDPALLRSYTGEYVGPFDLSIRLELADGELFSPAPYGRRRIVALGETTFLDEETGATLEVERRDGRVRRIAVSFDGSEVAELTPARSGSTGGR